MDIVKAIETIRDMIDVANTAGSACAYKHNGGVDRLRNVLDCLRNIELKRGHWIDLPMGRFIYAKCSECKSVHNVKSNFCPQCGAKMDEVEE